MLSIRSQATLILAVVLAGLPASSPARAAQCRQKGGQPQVFVKSKTAVRRGPGLNYPVASFLDQGRCMNLSEVSVDEAWVLIEDTATKTFGWVSAGALDGESRDTLPVDKKSKKRGPIGDGQDRGYLFTKSATGLLSRPDASSEPRKILPKKTRLLALAISEDGRWVQVRDARGETGWVGVRGLRDDGDTLASLPRMEGGLETGLKSGAKAAGGIAVMAGRPGGADDEEDAAPPPRRKARPQPAEAEEDEPPPPRSAKRQKPPKIRDEEPGEPNGPAIEDDGPKVVARRPARGSDFQLDLDALVLVGLPSHVLDSNGTTGSTRYSVHVTAPGLQLQALGWNLGPIRGRASYSFFFMSTINARNPASGTPATQTVNGQEHELKLIGGYPLQLRSLTVIPELGYVLELFGMQPYLPSAPRTPQFLSSLTHVANIDLAAIYPLSERVSINGQIGILAGKEFAYPFYLGAPGLTFGFILQAQLRYNLGGAFSLLASYDLRYQTTGFSATRAQPSKFDASITQATIAHLQNNIGVGASMAF